MIPRSNVGKSPYTHIQLGQQGGFVLAEVIVLKKF